MGGYVGHLGVGLDPLCGYGLPRNSVTTDPAAQRVDDSKLCCHVFLRVLSDSECRTVWQCWGIRRTRADVWVGIVVGATFHHRHVPAMEQETVTGTHRSAAIAINRAGATVSADPPYTTSASGSTLRDSERR